MSLRFFHISDSHVELISDETLSHRSLTNDGNIPLSISKTASLSSVGLNCVVNKIRNLVSEGLNVDFVIHTGDVCNSDDLPGQTNSTARLASQLLKECGVDYIWMNGNHDRLEHICPFRSSAEYIVFNKFVDHGTGSFWSAYKDTTMVFLDARPRDAEMKPDDQMGSYKDTKADDRLEWDGRHPQDPAGYLQPSELAMVEDLIANASGQVILFTHYPPVHLDCLWVDRSMCIKNGNLLHDILKVNTEKIGGVYFGHVHHSQQRLIDGVLYVATGAIASQFDTSAHLTESRMCDDDLHFLNYVHVENTNICIKQYCLISNVHDFK